MKKITPSGGTRNKVQSSLRGPKQSRFKEEETRTERTRSREEGSRRRPERGEGFKGQSSLRGTKQSRFKEEGTRTERTRSREEGSRRRPERGEGFKGQSSLRGTKQSRVKSQGPKKKEQGRGTQGTRTKGTRNYSTPVTRYSSPSKKPVKKQTDEGIRLNKFIANSGICSRREADEYIVAGLVSVNGKVVTEMGVKVQPDDDIRFNGERLKGERKVYIVMNKPKDFVTTMEDPNAEKTVMDLIGEDKCPQRVYPVGRLDKATTGVLLFTNDGTLAEQLTHPSYNKKKIYHIFLDKNFKQTDMQQLLDGVELDDGLAQADSLAYVDDDKTQIGLEIHSGRNRVVRRMFEALGYKVKKLDRVYFAGLTKKNLKRGQWRFLTDAEMNMLRMGAYE